MKVILSRTYNKNETIGSLYIFDGEKYVAKFKTIELPDNGNLQNISCIPEGTYDCIRVTSLTKGRCFAVLNVLNRDSILIHKGNFVKGNKIDSKGCILVGNYFEDLNSDGFIDVADSKPALEKLLTLLPAKFKLIII